jgi:ABC-2 type transport system ATP-binding protein
MSGNSIVIENLSKRFGSKIVFEECSYTVAHGLIFGLVGLNGAGKTTLIRLLSGLLKPDGGRLSVLGFTPWNHEERFFRRIGIVLENDGFMGNLTFRDNLRLFASAKGLDWPEVTSYLDDFWKGTFIGREAAGRGKKVKFFSRGQRMQCGLCRAFLGWPDMYFFDEPTVALDVDAYDHFFGMVRQAQARGSTVLISSHQLSFIEALCDEVGILDKNKLAKLSVRHTPAGQPWRITAPGDHVFKEIIERESGNPAVYSNGGWHFHVLDPAATIPEIVSLLCKAGCRVGEVRPEGPELREKMRTHYEKS